MSDNEVKAKKGKKAPIDKDAVPPHILRIMENVDKKSRQHKKEHEANKRATTDSISLIRNMMGSVRTNNQLSAVDDEMRKAKEKDIKMIAAAKDIFKEMEEKNIQEEQPRLEKHTMKVKDVDWMSEMPSKRRDEELKRKREREMEMMRHARQMTQEEEDIWQAESARKAMESKKQREREIEIMKMARAQAQEEEDMFEEEARRTGRKEPSPGLEAARGAMRRRQEEDMLEDNMRRTGRKETSPGLEAARSVMRREMIEDGPDKVEEMRMERIREIEEVRMARAALEEEERQERSARRQEDDHVARELDELRGARTQSVRERYNPEEGQNVNQRSKTFAKAPRSKPRSDTWMKTSGDERAEEMRLEREREIEEMKMARAVAIEEEEEERAEMEAIKREEAMRKAREMAMLVAELQRMRQEDHNDEEEKLTSYQEEMLTRVMELAALARGGIMSQ